MGSPGPMDGDDQSGSSVLCLNGVPTRAEARHRQAFLLRFPQPVGYFPCKTLKSFGLTFRREAKGVFHPFRNKREIFPRGDSCGSMVSGNSISRVFGLVSTGTKTSGAFRNLEICCGGGRGGKSSLPKGIRILKFHGPKFGFVFGPKTPRCGNMFLKLVRANRELDRMVLGPGAHAEKIF